MRVESERDAQK